MPIVPIDEVEEGQTLAQGARVGNGAILAPPGTTLSAELIARLEGLGVTELDVRQSIPGPSPAEQLEALERRFVGHDDDELMLELKEVVRTHIASAGQGTASETPAEPDEGSR